MTLQSRIQYEPVSGEDSSKTLNVVFDDISGHIAIDYSSYYARIASSLETIAEKLTAMETYQKKLKELGEGEGIHVISPYDLFSFITTYRILVEEGKLMEWREKQPSDKEIGKALNDIGKYIDKIRQNIPRSF